MTRTVIYSMGVSLDGFTAGPDGDIGWAAPDAELMAFHNEQTKKIDAVFCGRGLYEDMLPWESAEQIWTDPAALEFARIWRAIPKVVFSTTLDTVTGNARLARDDVVTELARAPEGVVSVGGPHFATALGGLDLIDEYRLFVNPIVLGGGTVFMPRPDKPVDLRLLEQRTFGSGVVYLRYERSR